MKILFFLISTLLGFMLLAVKGTAFTEQVLHHGYMVDISGDIRDCLACHDGTVATVAYYCITNCSLNTAHSILKDYPPRNDADSYAPVATLWEHRIRLYNGKTTCISCHDLKNPHKSHLAVDNTGSKLCFTCHLK